MEGGVVTENQFTSATDDPSTEYVGNTEFYVESKTGRDVSSLSASPEYEVLFPPGTKFRVKEVYTDYASQRRIVPDEV